MAVKCQTIINEVEQFAPKHLAEEWDNVGLQVGSPAADIHKILVTLDVNNDVVDEALELGANMIIAHHPLFYKPIKNLRFDTPFGSLINRLIQNGISVYAAHTNLDSAKGGVNAVLARKLGLRKVEVLNPDKEEVLVKLAVFVPADHEEAVREAVTKAGAGRIGNYSDCTFETEGIGTFKAREGTEPFIGKVGELEKVEEKRIETILPKSILAKTIKAMIKAHPYEEVAYDVYPLLNRGTILGLGRIGLLEDETTLQEFSELVKRELGVSHVKVVGESAAKINKVSVCGGGGAGLINKAKFAGADVMVTGDIKYHEAQEAKAIGLNIIDAGHNGTEVVIVKELADYLRQSLTKENILVEASKVNTDPFMFI